MGQLGFEPASSCLPVERTTLPNRLCVVLFTSQLFFCFQFQGDKSKNDFQTEADRSAETCIISSLAAQFPAITIIGEEARESGHSHETCDVPPEWIVSGVDEAILAKQCPKSLESLSEKDVRNDR